MANNRRITGVNVDDGADNGKYVKFNSTSKQFEMDTPGGGSIGSTSGVSAGPASSTTQTITHGLGRTPVTIRLHGIGAFESSASGRATSFSMGAYTGSGNRCVYMESGTGPYNGQSSTSFAVRMEGANGNDAASGVVQNITATTFDIVWTTSADLSASTVFHWEAQ